MYKEQCGEYAYWCQGVKGLITPWSDSHATSPYNIHIIQQAGNENIQAHQVEIFILI